jgi:radical SAM protein with 4Fe4S-binding SPASM domain
LIDGLARHVNPREVLAVLTGGEPLLAPAWDAVTTALHRGGIRWGLVSNGWALDDVRLAEARARGLCSLTVSLDGLEAAHDRLRGRGGSFNRAVAVLTQAAASGVPMVDAVTCVHSANLDELPGVLELLRAREVSAWRLVAIYPRGRAGQNRDLLLSPADWRRLFDWIAATRAAEGRGGVNVQFGCEGYLPHAVDRAVRAEPYFCRAGIAIGSVLANGDISACPNIGRDMVQGNVRHDDLLDVWEHRFEPFRDRGWARRGRCATCDEWKRCQGNSLHLRDAGDDGPAVCHCQILGDVIGEQKEPGAVDPIVDAARPHIGLRNGSISDS